MSEESFGRKPVFEVRVSKNGEALADHYRAVFRAKFGIDPVLELDDTDITRWLARQVGNDLAKGKLIIETYFTLDDREFVENAYTLFWLKKKINRVLSFVGKRAAATTASRTMTIDTTTYCANPRCIPGSFRLICKPEQLDTPLYCAKCAPLFGAVSLEVLDAR